MTKPETQLALHKIAHRFGVRPDIEPAFNKAIEDLFTQALTTLRDEMEKKKHPLKVTWHPKQDDVMRYGENKAISECQRLLDEWGK